MREYYVIMKCNVQYCCSISTELGISRQFPESRLTEILPVETVLTQEDLGQVDKRTDDQQTDMTKLTGCFRNYTTAQEN
jgi:hypothetical protein